MHAPSRPLLLVSLLLVCLWLDAAARPARAAETAPPIVFVVFDEMPTVSLLDAEGQIDAALYPNFAALAATSTWARGASTVATRLLESVPALLTGRMPGPERTLSIRAAFPDNLFTWLEDEYELNVREQQSMLGPTRMDADGQARWLNDVRSDRYRGPAQDRFFQGFLEVIERQASVAAKSGDEAKPALDFIHVLLPYGAWRHSATGRLYSPHRLEGNIGGIWQGDDAVIEDAWRRHLNEVRFADVLLGRLVATLKEIGRFDESLVIVTSSYGAGFWADESRRTPSRTTHPEDVLLVPLFVKLPGQKKGVVNGAVVQSIDVVPTIVDALGREAPWPMDGCSILDVSCARPADRASMRLDGSRQARTIDPYPADLHRRRPTLERKLALFPDVAHLDRSWPAGRFESWLGQTPERAAPAAGKEAAGLWSMDRSARDWRGRGNGGPRFVGNLELEPVGGDSEAAPWVAIALNGRLEAVAKAVLDRRGRLVVRAMLPEAALKPKGNELALYLISEEGGKAKLAPLARKVPVMSPKQQKKTKPEPGS